MSESILPLEIKSKLAATPQSEPKFSVEVQLSSGTKTRFSDPKAIRAMIALMDMQAVMGGAASHWGGPSGFAELMSAVHGVMYSESKKNKTPWYELFHFVNDAGHCENGLYALKANYGFADLNLDSLKGFRSILSPLTGHGESHLFPEGVLLSNGPLGSALPQAQGLSYADGLTETERVTVVAISDGACMEGEVRESLAAIPGLATQQKLAPFIMIISDNNTGLTGRIDASSYSMQPTFESLTALGWDVLHLEQAHDLQTCVDFFEQAVQRVRKNPTRPVAIHAKTTKGYGVKKTADSSSGGHGFPLKSPTELPEFLKEIYMGYEVPEVFTAWIDELIQKEAAKEATKKAASSNTSVVKQKVQVGVSEALTEARKKGLPIFSVSSDLPGSTGLGGFQKAYPLATQDVGVMEANMVSMAAGLSKSGFIPIVDTFAQFGVTKGALPLIMSSLSEAPIIGIFSHIGFQDAADGASHQSLMYLAMTSAIPNVDVYTLSSSDEAKALITEVLATFATQRLKGQVPRTSLFFLGREDYPANYSEYTKTTATYALNKSTVLADFSEGSRSPVLIVTSGTLSFEAVKAAQSLKDRGMGSIVIHPGRINRPDLDSIATALKKCDGRMVTVEDHQLVAGMGAMLTHELVLKLSNEKSNLPLKVKSLGVKGTFGQSAYKASELYAKHGLDAHAITQAAVSLVL